jgi:hypothetical protein
MTTNKKCYYPDWESHIVIDTHIFGKDGYCCICGNKQELKAHQLDETVSGWTCDKCGTKSNVGYRCSWCESPRPTGYKLWLDIT